MDKAYIEAIKTRLAAATAGPWLLRTGKDYHSADAQGRADLEFVEAARTDVELLVQEVERLSTALKDARAAERKWLDWGPALLLLVQRMGLPVKCTYDGQQGWITVPPEHSATLDRLLGAQSEAPNADH